MKLPNRTVLTFAAGAVAALAAGKFLKSKTAHNLAVRGVAGGMRVKDAALKTAENIREEALDIYEEAKRNEV